MKEYQPHLTGIRALAILLVVIYHVCEPICPRGYYGVSIFFVLSGYLLISGLHRLEPTQLSFKEFTRKKVLRIYPSLVTLILSVLVLCVFLFPPHMLTRAADTGLTSLLAASNIYLDECTGGYFATNVAENPFVHTWFLSITIQLYIIFFTGWIILGYTPEKYRIGILVVIGAASMIWAHQNEVYKIFGKTDSITTYYWTTARIWEMLAGGLVFLTPAKISQRWKHILTILALAAIIVLSFRPSRNPGFADVAIVAATIVLIAYTPTSCIRQFFENKAVQWLGKISFSLYLWHWPVFAIWCWLSGTPTACETGLIILTGLILATVTYHLVEKPRFPILFTGIAWGVTGILAGILAATRGGMKNSAFLSYYEQVEYPSARAYTGNSLRKDLPAFTALPNRLDSHDRYLLHYTSKNKELLFQIGEDSKEPTFLLIGDSHAQVLYPGFDTVAKGCQIAGVYLHTYILPFYGSRIPMDNPSMDCTRERLENLLKWLSLHPEITHVYVANIWWGRLQQVSREWSGEKVPREQREVRFASSLHDFCKVCTEMGKKVVLLADAPYIQAASPMKDIMRSKILNKSLTQPDDHTDTHQAWLQRNEKVNAVIKQIETAGHCTVIDASNDLYANNGIFSAFHNNEILMRDKDHLSVKGAQHFMKYHEASLRCFHVPSRTSP